MTNSRSNTNCFTLTREGSLTAGIRLTVGASSSGGRALPPHVAVGGSFIKLGQRKPVVSGDFVLGASLKTIMGRRKQFKVLARSEPDVSEQLVFIDLTLGAGKHLRPDLNIWSGITGDAQRILTSKNEALVRFTRDDQVAFVCFADGSVLGLARVDGVLRLSDMPAKLMAEVRMNQAREMLPAYPNDDRRRYDGIIFGAISLLRVAYDDEARGEIVEFLRNRELTSVQRQKAIAALRHWNDSRQLHSHQGVRSAA